MRKSISRLVLVLAIFAAAAFLVAKLARGGRYESAMSRSLPAMGTILEIKLYGEKEALPGAADAAVDEIRRIEKVFSIFGDGEAVRINDSASKAPVKCSGEMWNVLMECRKYHGISEGAFDITIRPMMQLWGFYRKREQMPSDGEIKEALARTGFEKLRLDEKEKTIFFTVDGMSLDFGGIVKGYAVDRAVAKIMEKGVMSGFVNLGGNIRTLPEPPPGKESYKIGVRHPTRGSDICGSAKIAGGKALATSGNYERYVLLGNKHITHIINPTDGRPVENMLSVTVVAPDAISTDALSTSVFIRGGYLARKIHSENPQVEFLVIRRDADGGESVEKFGDSWGEIGL